MWIIFAVLTVIAWGCSDVCFKKSIDDDSSVLDLIQYNGIIYFGITVIYMIARGVSFNFSAIVGYLPAGLCYLASMFSYYAAFKYSKVSLVSPIANASCAITSLLCVFVLRQSLDFKQIIAVIVITVSIALLSNPGEEKEKTRKKIFLIGFFLALGYTLLDGLGSFFDEVFIDVNVVEKGVCTEDDVIVAYATLYFVAALVCTMIKLFKRIKNRNVPKVKKKFDKWKLIGTLFETGGEYAYVYTYASQDAAIASPFIASFSAVSIILSRIFLKEKITKKQYILVGLIIVSMFVLGIE